MISTYRFAAAKTWLTATKAMRDFLASPHSPCPTEIRAKAVEVLHPHLSNIPQVVSFFGVIIFVIGWAAAIAKGFGGGHKANILHNLFQRECKQV